MGSVRLDALPPAEGPLTPQGSSSVGRGSPERLEPPVHGGAMDDEATYSSDDFRIKYMKVDLVHSGPDG